MIDVIKQTPIQYSVQSRDYQVLARLYTALYNLNKMYIDDTQIWDTNIDNKLSNLRATTLNFIPKHDWDLDELDTIMYCFKYIMKRKGTIQALSFCLTIFLRIKKLTGEISDSRGSVEFEDNEVLIKVPGILTTSGIIEDLFDYLLPAGLTYRILEYRRYDVGDVPNKVGVSDDVSVLDLFETSEMGIYNDTLDSSSAGFDYKIDSSEVQSFNEGNRGKTLYINGIWNNASIKGLPEEEGEI